MATNPVYHRACYSVTAPQAAHAKIKQLEAASNRPDDLSETSSGHWHDGQRSFHDETKTAPQL